MDGAFTQSAADLAFQRGVEFHGRGMLEEAAGSYREALAIDDGHIAALINLGSIHFSCRDFAGAAEKYERALARDPSNVVATSNLGAALSGLGQIPAAIERHAAAIMIDPSNAAAFNNYADCLNTADRHELALEMATKALALRPDYAEAYCNLGHAFYALGRPKDAIAAFRKASEIKPALWSARKNLGMALLHCGEFAEGWREYDWRFLADASFLRPQICAVWDGGAVAGNLLICSEQGIGDQILQFGMAEDLVTAGHRVVWEVEPRLLGLFARAQPSIRFVPREFPPCDPGIDASVSAQYPALSLGRLLRGDKDAFPRRAAYLRADPERVEEIRCVLDLAPGEKLVGIAWRSANAEIGALKSTDLAEWGPVLEIPGVRFVSLQYGADESGLAVEGLDVTNDLEGLAALISLCSAVVTVSSATAHLAGALGVPAYVLVGAGRGTLWCWGNGTETPWYPTARIIRQDRGAPWTFAMITVAELLQDFLEHGGLDARSA